MLGFKSNDGFINFIIILFFSIILLSIGETTSLVSQKFTSTLQLSTGYYIIGFLLILGLILNLFLSFEILKSKKKEQFVKIVNNSQKEEDHKQNIKGLFENSEQTEEKSNEDESNNQ